MRLLTLFLLSAFCSLLSASAQTPGVSSPFAAVFNPPDAASAPAAPALVGEIQRNIFSSSTASTMNLSNNVSAGRTISLLAIAGAADVLVASVADTAGNTWTVRGTVGGNHALGVASAYLTTGLTTTDTITVTWAAATFTGKGVVLLELADVASAGQPDVAATNSAFGTTVTVSGVTTVPTVCTGLVAGSSTAQTYGSSAWTVLGGVIDVSGKRGNVVYITPEAGTQNPAGTWTGNVNQNNLWVGFK